MAEVIAADGPGTIGRAVAVLEAAGTVVLPTDTVYGIAALPDRPRAVEQIFELKQRPADMHLAVLVADADQVARVSSDDRRAPRRLMARFWPGPLTIVLPEASDLVSRLGPGDGTVGVRCPDDELVRELARRVGPLATTSANLHGQPAARTAAEVARQLPGADLVIDGGPSGAGLASTVVRATGDELEVLRAGPIPQAALIATWRGGKQF